MIINIMNKMNKSVHFKNQTKYKPVYKPKSFIIYAPLALLGMNKLNG